MTARLTVVVPTLGTRPEWLALALDTIRRQRVPVRVVAVVPQDAVGSVAAACADLDSTVIVQSTPGLTGAINDGFREADTEYVGWLGDDDLLVPDTAHLLVEALDADPGAPMAFGRIYIIDGDGTYRHTVRPTRWGPALVSVLRNFLPQQGTVFRRSALAEIGLLDERLEYAMDLDVFLRLRRRGRAAYVPVPVAAFRYHASGLTLTNPSWGEEAQQVRLAHASRPVAAVVRVAEAPLGILTRVVYKLGVLREDQRPEQLNRVPGVLPKR